MLLLALALALAAQEAPDLSQRWLYSPSNLLVDENV